MDFDNEFEAMRSNETLLAQAHLRGRMAERRKILRDLSYLETRYGDYLGFSPKWLASLFWSSNHPD